jgi:cullin 3
MHYLSPQTAGPLRQIVENSLVSPHLETIITMPNSGLDVMIDMDQYDDLARLYRLFAMVSGGLVCLKRALKQSIDRRGQEVNRASFGTDTGDVLVDADGLDEGKPLKGKVRPPNVAAQTLSLALKWVQDVLDLKEKIDRIWKKSFQTNRELESGINEVRFCGSISAIFSRSFHRRLGSLLTLMRSPRSTYPYLSTKISRKASRV